MSIDRSVLKILHNAKADLHLLGRILARNEIEKLAADTLQVGMPSKERVSLSGPAVLLPPKGRISLIYVDDLARLLLALTAAEAPKRIVVEPDDGTPGGWSHKDFAQALGKAVGRRNVSLSAPRPLLHLAARLDRLVRRDRAKLTPDRAAYFAHPDWVANSGHSPPPELWHPRVETNEGLAATAAWYRDQGWL